MSHARTLLARGGLVACLVGCGSLPSLFAQKVEVVFDHEADFSRIRSYQWRTHPLFEKNPELQATYATGIQLVLQAGNAQLMKRGLQPDESSPDVFVTFFLLTKEAQRLKKTMEPAWGADYAWAASPYSTVTTVETYLRGMLVIDIVDPRTERLLWRAYCGDQVKDMRKRDQNINSAVRKALGKFPPR